LTIAEPMTVATDYLLAAVTAWLAWKLGRSSRAQQLWTLAFAALALGALLGGTWHGFLKANLLWKATLISIGFASFAMVAGSAFSALRGGWRVLVLALAGAKLLAYAGWMLRHDGFVYVVLDTGLALVAVLAMHLWRRDGWMLAGVALSVAAALAQASGLALHRHFNHNDLYHVIQAAAMFLLYRGARRLTDAAAPRRAPPAA
jgi:hypothetical protein